MKTTLPNAFALGALTLTTGCVANTMAMMTPAPGADQAFEARLAWCEEMAKSPDYFLVDGNPPFTECPGLRERGAEIAKAQAEEAAQKQAALDADLAVWNDKTIAPARAALATDVALAARLIGLGFQGNRQSFSWEPEKEAATFIDAELKPRVDALVAGLPTSHARLQSLTGETCVLCDEGDTEPGCFLLAVDGLTSLSSADSSVPVVPQPQP